MDPNSPVIADYQQPDLQPPGRWTDPTRATLKTFQFLVLPRVPSLIPTPRSGLVEQLFGTFSPAAAATPLSASARLAPAPDTTVEDGINSLLFTLTKATLSVVTPLPPGGTNPGCLGAAAVASGARNCRSPRASDQRHRRSRNCPPKHHQLRRPGRARYQPHRRPHYHRRCGQRRLWAKPPASVPLPCVAASTCTCNGSFRPWAYPETRDSLLISPALQGIGFKIGAGP